MSLDDAVNPGETPEDFVDVDRIDPGNKPKPLHGGKVTLIRDPNTLKHGVYKNKQNPDQPGVQWFYLKFQALDGIDENKTFGKIITTRKYPWRNSSEVIDFLWASGNRARPKGEDEEATQRAYLAEVEKTVGPFQAVLGVEGKCDECNHRVYSNKGDVFVGEDGQYQPVDCEECGAPILPETAIKRFVIPRKSEASA